jgi:hypothetical protein
LTVLTAICRIASLWVVSESLSYRMLKALLSGL